MEVLGTSTAFVLGPRLTTGNVGRDRGRAALVYVIYKVLFPPHSKFESSES